MVFFSFLFFLLLHEMREDLDEMSCEAEKPRHINIKASVVGLFQEI